ncbi:MAG: hypothetical protein WAW16_08415 [Candidatus Cryosericum sp.]
MAEEKMSEDSAFENREMREMASERRISARDTFAAMRYRND